MKLLEWYNFWWMKLPTPRVFSLLYTMVYVGAITVGILTYFFPPPSLLGSLGSVSTKMMGILFVMGGIVGGLGGARDAWRLERIGIFSISLSLLAYLATMIHFGLNASGNYYTQLGAIYFSIILFAVRLAMIWRYTYRPESRS